MVTIMDDLSLHVGEELDLTVYYLDQNENDIEGLSPECYETFVVTDELVQYIMVSHDDHGDDHADDDHADDDHGDEDGDDHDDHADDDHADDDHGDDDGDDHDGHGHEEWFIHLN